jgi:hypothetical protein
MRRTSIPNIPDFQILYKQNDPTNSGAAAIFNFNNRQIALQILSSFQN